MGRRRATSASVFGTKVSAPAAVAGCLRFYCHGEGDGDRGRDAMAGDGFLCRKSLLGGDGPKALSVKQEGGGLAGRRRLKSVLMSACLKEDRKGRCHLCHVESLGGKAG